MPWPLIGAIAGGAIAAGASALGQARANRATRELAREQMRFQERMSSTSYRRAMEDLRLAGLNPMLAMTGGASSPGGAMATMQDVMGPAVSSAMSALRLREEMKLMKQQRYKTEMEGREANIRGTLYDTQRRILAAGTKDKAGYVTPYAVDMDRLSVDAMRAQNKLRRFSMPAARIMGTKEAGIIRAILGGSALSQIIRPRR